MKEHLENGVPRAIAIHMTAKPSCDRAFKADSPSLPAKWSVRRVSVVNDLLFETRAPHG